MLFHCNFSIQCKLTRLLEAHHLYYLIYSLGYEKQKLYREDLSIKDVALIRYNTMVGIMEDPLLGDDPAPRGALLHYSLLLHIRAIASAQGLVYLQEFQQHKTL